MLPVLPLLLASCRQLQLLLLLYERGAYGRRWYVRVKVRAILDSSLLLLLQFYIVSAGGFLHYLSSSFSLGC